MDNNTYMTSVEIPYELTWNGTTHHIVVPTELEGSSEQARWAFVQTIVCSKTKTKDDALRAALGVDCPGLGFEVEPSSHSPLPFSWAVWGLNASASSSSGTSCPVVPPNTHSQTRPPFVPAPNRTRGALGIGGGHRRPPPIATSIALQHPFHGQAAAVQSSQTRTATQSAMLRKAGWTAQGTTIGPYSGGGPVAAKH